MRGTRWTQTLCILCILGLGLVAACGATGDKKPPPVRTAKDRARIAEAIKRRQVLYAMTKGEVLQSIGKPIRKKSETYYGRERQRWDYNSFSVLFDDDGYVVRLEGAGY